MKRVVVVGAGIAGLRTVLALRSRGFAGEVVLLGAEGRLPYDRPPLSKAVLFGAADDTTLEADWDSLGVTLQLDRPATGLRPGVVETRDGDLPFDGLVLATGARPVTLPGTGPPGVRTLRTADDALALRAELAPDREVVVVGAGWLGAEVATAAARRGARVTVVEAFPTPLAGALPTEIGVLTVPWYAEAGISLRLGTRVAAAEPGAVRLADGSRLAADVVVLGLGVRPDTGWLDDAVVRDRRGAVLTDAGLRTSMPGVYAVGDCAARESRRYGVRLHLEHWDDALRAPDVAAANLLGEHAEHDPVPYFWSDQLGRTLQYVGHHPAGQRLLWRGEPERDRDWAAFWLRNDRVVACLAVGRPRDLLQGRRLAERGLPVDQALLADPDRPVRDAVAG